MLQLQPEDFIANNRTRLITDIRILYY